MSKLMLMTSPLIVNDFDLKKSALNNGLLYLASFQNNYGHEAKIVDTIFEGWDNVRRKEGNVTEYGLSDETIESRIKEYDPDVIGINLVATVSYDGFLNLSKSIKTRFPEKLIIAGGSHVSALPEKVLRDSNVDLIIHGEGEIPVFNILSNLGDYNSIKKIKGVGFLDNDLFVLNPRENQIQNLDDIGPLNIDLIKDIPYTEEPTYGGSAFGKKYADLILSRGCPNTCSFCQTNQLWGTNLRRHSKEWISATLDAYIEAGFEHFLLQDDAFTRAPDLCDDVMNLFYEKGVSWENNGGFEAEDLSPKLVQQMVKKNCTTLFIPFNFRTEETDNLSEGAWAHYKRILESAKNNNAYVYTSHIMGFPEQTLNGMEMQAKLARELIEEGLCDFHVVYAFSVLPGTGRFSKIMRETANGEYEVRKGNGIDFFGGWQNWPLYSINSPQIGTQNFSFDKFRTLYYDSIRYINGKKADAWFNGKEWPK